MSTDPQRDAFHSAKFMSIDLIVIKLDIDRFTRASEPVIFPDGTFLSKSI